nr:zinc finger, CCHC-type [Tanacetum cinerariifolium]
MASINTRLNIKKLDGNIKQKHGGSKQVGFKQFGPGLETGVHDEKSVWFEVKLQGAQRDREAESGVTKHLRVAGIQQQNGLVNETNVTLFDKVLQDFEFEVEPQKDHTFEGEPHGNVDHVVGSQEVQTQDLIYYHSARDMEHHSALELFSYIEDSNEAAFAVTIVDKIYAHELLTLNNTVACEVNFKWEAGLKDDMDAQSDVYVLSNGCRKYSDDIEGYY